MAQQLEQAAKQAKYYTAQLDKELSRYPQLIQFEQRTQIPKVYAVLGGSTIFFFSIFFNVFAGFLTNLIGWAVPAYLSMQALQSPQPQDDVQWLTYWTVFGFFNFVESFVEIILYWFPFYYTFKTAIIVYLALPQTRGAQTVYAKVFQPLFLQTHRRTTSAGPTTSTSSSAAAPAPVTTGPTSTTTSAQTHL